MWEELKQSPFLEWGADNQSDDWQVIAKTVPDSDARVGNWPEFGWFFESQSSADLILGPDCEIWIVISDKCEITVEKVANVLTTDQRPLINFVGVFITGGNNSFKSTKVVRQFRVVSLIPCVEKAIGQLKIEIL